MKITLDVDKVPDDIQLPDKGCETIIWLKSWSDESDEVYFHRIVISRVETVDGITQFQAHFQLFRNDEMRKYDLIEKVVEQC